MYAFFAGIGTWLLQIFLGGIFGKIETQVQDAAQSQEDAAKEHAQTTQESANTEVVIITEQGKVKDHYSAEVPNPADPFHSADWNSEK